MENDYRVVLCGSMRQFDLMETIASILNELGVTTQLPAPYKNARYLPQEEYIKIKKELSRSHFQLIADDSTAAILVVNPNIDNSKYHIGANTIADITIAFWTEKRIFLYTDLPENLTPELCAWDAVALREKLDVLVEYMESKL
jgi:hypothetical protein